MKINKIIKDSCFCDRLSGKPSSRLPDGKTTLGRWLLMAPSSSEIFLNSVPAHSGDYLVPEASGSWRLVSQTGAIQQGGFWRRQFPDELEEDSIRTIGQHLQNLVEDEGTWLEWLDVVPLAPGMSDSADLLPLECSIQDLAGHLEEVCRKPRAHLQIDIDRVPVARARRLPSRASSYLASHTEDWERPLIRGVLPKRVLAEVRHDQIDIYENRVAARLVDHLAFYLAKRIRQIRKLLKVFKDKEDYSGAVGGTYLRRRRILEIWGESIDSNEGKKRAEFALKKLEWLRYRMMSLMDSPLYREVPRKTFVSPTLRATNILTNDQNYRRVAELWRTWVGAGHGRTLAPENVHREAQELCQGMNSFAFLLTVRALDQLGFEISEHQFDTPIGRPGQWQVTKSGSSANLELDEMGRIRFSGRGRSLTFIPIPANIGATTNEDHIREVIDQFLSATPTKSGTNIILFAGDPSEVAHKLPLKYRSQLLTVGNDPRVGLPSGFGFLPVSPWDIGSVERICRALRWFIDSTRFDEYPLSIHVAKEAQGTLDIAENLDWLEVGAHGAQFTFKRPPQTYEWDALRIQTTLDSAREEHRRATEEHERLSQELRNAVRKGRTGTLNQEKHSAHQKCVETEKRVTAVEKLATELEGAHTKISALLDCPACGTGVDPQYNFEIRAKGCFRCICPECSTSWATRLCGHGHRYAVMLPGGEFVDANEDDCGWEDRTYGSDLLAMPARTKNGNWGFVCPVCGDVT